MSKVDCLEEIRGIFCKPTIYINSYYNIMPNSDIGSIVTTMSI
jgi:hypothetical protein